MKPEDSTAELERWGKLIRRFVHDLRSPLTVIKSNVDYLRETPLSELGDEAGPVFDDLSDAVRQAEALLSALDDATAAAREGAAQAPSTA